MELLIALLTQFGVLFSSEGDILTLKWTEDNVKYIYNSNEYQEFVAKTGYTLLDEEGRPACNVTVMEYQEPKK